MEWATILEIITTLFSMHFELIVQNKTMLVLDKFMSKAYEQIFLGEY